jgi:putative ABC transport system permease protein
MKYVILICVALSLLGGAAKLFSSDKGRRGFVLALRSLWLHKLRSVLSVLGIIIGTLAVVTLIAVGEGTMKDALDDIARQGATNIIIRSVKPPDDSSTQRRTRVALYGLTYADYERFMTIPNITQRVPMRIFPTEIRYLDRLRNGRVVATTADYTEVNDVKMTVGRFLNQDDDDQMRNVAVLGSDVADRLFPFEDPLKHTVRLGNYLYDVIGVIANRMPLAAVGGSSQANAEDFNNDVYIPLKTCRVRFGDRIMIRQSGSMSGEQVELSQITLTVRDMDSVRPTGEVVKDLIERAHYKNDYAVTVPLDRLEAAQREKDRLTIQLAIVACISLLVGGIGIMNIMLATVTERTREIGIRRALGAKRKDIILQFLIEAVVQTTLGGLIGAALGVVVVYSLPWLAEHLFSEHQPTVLNVPWIFYSLTLDLFVGVTFGLYPAWRASRLDPIEALRHA